MNGVEGILVCLLVIKTINHFQRFSLNLETIEHQGSQHFYKTRFSGETEEKLQHRINNDKIKIKECYDNDVKLLFFTYELTKTPSNCFYDLIFNEEELKRKILNYQQL